jgi:hypothetical protein
MTLVGWVPWLLDTLNHEDEAFNCYVNQLSVLLPQKNRPKRSVPRWRAWLPMETIKRACPTCLSEFSRKDIFKLMWQFPLFISCPTHGCWLESFYCYPDRLYGWTDEQLLPRQASNAITKMDQRTEQAFTKGHVELPRGKIHAGLWFRLLRTLIEELNTPLNCGTQSRRMIWKITGHPLRAGQHHWYPFEILDLPTQLQFLEAAAMAINMLETGAIEGLGTHAYLFLPEPKSVVENDSQALKTQQPSDGVTDCWHIAMESLNKAIDAARHDPREAQMLFGLMIYGRKNDKHIKAVRENLKSLGIPEEWCQIE